MNQDDPNKHGPKKDRHWNQLYWAHILVFFGFIALIAVEVLVFSPTFPPQAVAIRSVAAAPFPALSVKGHPQEGAPTLVKGSEVTTTPQNPPAPAPPRDLDHWSSGDVVSAMSNFYTTIIAILVALIGIMGVLAGFTLRSLSRAAAEDTAHEQAKVAIGHYVSTPMFARIVSTAVNDTAVTADMEKLAEEVDKMRRLLAKRLGISNETGGEDLDGQVEQQAPGPEQL